MLMRFRERILKRLPDTDVSILQKLHQILELVDATQVLAAVLTSLIVALVHPAVP